MDQKEKNGGSRAYRGVGALSVEWKFFYKSKTRVRRRVSIM